MSEWIISLSISVSILLIIYISLLARKFFYRKYISNNFPNLENLSNYQKSVINLRKYNSKSVNPLFEKMIIDRKFFVFIQRIIGLLLYRAFHNRYFAFNQYPVVVISSYGNISEVARRKFSTDSGMNQLREAYENLSRSLLHNKYLRILKALADIYRVMYDKETPSSVQLEMKILDLKTIEDILAKLKELDLVNAYIKLRRFEDKLSEMSDIEIIIYGALRIRFERFIISYRYPIKTSLLEEEIYVLTKLLEFIKIWIEYKHKFLVKISALVFLLDYLNCEIKEKNKSKRIPTQASL